MADNFAKQRRERARSTQSLNEAPDPGSPQRPAFLASAFEQAGLNAMA